MVASIATGVVCPELNAISITRPTSCRETCRKKHVPSGNQTWQWKILDEWKS